MARHYTKIRSEETFKQIKDLSNDDSFSSFSPMGKTDHPVSLPLYNSNDHKYYGSNRLYHSITVGPSGSGKTSTIIIPQILNQIAQGGAFSSFASRDVIEATYDAAAQAGYDIYVLDFENLDESDCYNFLRSSQLLYEKGTAGSIHLASDGLKTRFQVLLTSYGQTTDVFWEHSGAKTCDGGSHAMLVDKDWGELNLPDLSEYLSNCYDNLGLFKMKYKELIKEDPGVSEMSCFIFSANETRSSIYSVVNEKLSVFNQDILMKYLFSNHDFPNFTHIMNRKVAFYIVLPFHSAENYLPMIKLFLLDLVQGLTASTNKLNDETGNRFLISCDEFASYAFEELSTYISNSRKYNIVWSIALQSLNQLDQFGSNFKSIIMDNCMIKVYLAMNNLQAMQEISQNSGDVTIYYEDKTVVRKAISMNDLKEMPFNSAFIQYGNLTIFDFLTPYYTMKEYSNIGKYIPKRKITIEDIEIDNVFKKLEREKYFNDNY